MAARKVPPVSHNSSVAMREALKRLRRLVREIRLRPQRVYNRRRLTNAIDAANRALNI